MQLSRFLYTSLRLALSLLVVFETWVAFRVNFSNYQHGRAVFLTAACMTLYCLYRLSFRVRA